MVRVLPFHGSDSDDDGIFPQDSRLVHDITEPLFRESTSQATNLELIQQYHARCKEEACTRSHAAEVLAPNTPNRARQVIISFCNRTALTLRKGSRRILVQQHRVAPSERDLEELWTECNALVTSGESKMGMAMVSTAIIYALCDLLLSSNGQEWKPQLRVLVLLQFLHSRGGLATFIAKRVIVVSDANLKHLTEVAACREEALKVIQLTQPAEGAPPVESPIELALRGGASEARDQSGGEFEQPEESLESMLENHMNRREVTEACTRAAAAHVLSADTPGEATRLIVGFCNHTAGMRVTPADKDLEDLWSKCSALIAGSDSKMAKSMIATAMIYALCDQLSCSPLGALALLQFLRCRGDLERFVVEMVVDETSELLGSLSRNEGPFQMASLQLLGVTGKSCLQPKVAQEAVSPCFPFRKACHEPLSSPNSPAQEPACEDGHSPVDEEEFCVQTSRCVQPSRINQAGTIAGALAARLKALSDELQELGTGKSEENSGYQVLLADDSSSASDGI